MSLDYGIIGNCKTAALVKRDLSIDWCCFPDFDSPSVFARLLDQEKGGTFQLTPVDPVRGEQNYINNTNLLRTVITTKTGKFEVIDYFPLYQNGGDIVQVNALHRVIKVLEGKPQIKVNYDPKLDYARANTKISIDQDYIVASDNGDKLFLYTNLDPKAVLNSEPITLHKNALFILSYKQKVKYHNFEDVDCDLNKTIHYWKNYIENHEIPDFKDKDYIIRSILALKLLTYHQTGAVIAAATTSIPETIGEERNWDYRYCWLRDASFTVDALTKVCSFEELDAFLKFVLQVCRICLNKDFHLHIMYSVHRELNLQEHTLDHLAGYKNSKPVRIGNAAYNQVQHDVYGEVMDLIYHFFVTYKHKETISGEIFQYVEKMVAIVAQTWQEQDSGIWEMRDIKEDFVFSKVMAWVTVDRAIKLAEHFNHRCDLETWKELRHQIRTQIMEQGWNQEKQAFTIHYNTNKLDASLLLMPLYDFISPKDPKFASTVRAIEKELTIKPPLLKRYNMTDDFGKPQNAFIITGFWLVDALYLIGDHEKAEQYYHQLLEYANHLKLFSEDIDANTKELLGNFPQAYTHVALINTAYLLHNGGKLKRPNCPWQN